MQFVFILFALLTGMFQTGVKPLGQDSLKQYLETNKAPFDFILIDVRTAQEITAAIGNTACKPYNFEWATQFKDISAKVPKHVTIIVYCRSGSRSARAASFLSASGYSSVYDAGGILTWNGPTVPPSEIKPVSVLPEPSMKAAR
jgi:rhodanese-related sulfurtransferase